MSNWTTPETPSTVAWRDAALRLMRAVMIEDARFDLTPETLRACDAVLHLAGITALGRGEYEHPKKTDRILWNRRNQSIDEIVVHDCTIHIEQMTYRTYWISVDKGDRHWMGNFSSLQLHGSLNFCGEPDGDWTWDRDESHEEKR